MQWKEIVINKFSEELKRLKKANDTLSSIKTEGNTGIHLAVFIEPYMTLLFEKHKTIESRFSVNRISPYKKIKRGDIVLIKKSGGDILGFFTVRDVEFFSNLSTKVLKEIEEDYGDKICTSAQEDFWDKRKHANYASLITVDKVYKTRPIKVNKKSRSGWVSLGCKKDYDNKYENSLLFNCF